MKLERLTCKHKNKKGQVCEWTWIPRIEDVVQCPKCKCAKFREVRR